MMAQQRRRSPEDKASEIKNRILNQILGYQRQIERRTQQIDKNTQEIKRQVIKGVGEDRALDNYVN